MKQRTIWILLLAIGVLSSLQSCSKIEEKPVYEEYNFVNNSGSDISIKSYFESIENNFIISKGDSIMQKVELVFGSCSDIIFFSDSVIVKFGDNKKTKFTRDINSPHNLLKRDNYSETLKSSNYRVYKYTFTNKDLGK